MGWLLEMYLSNTATFLPCIVTGISGSFVLILLYIILVALIQTLYILLQLPSPQLESALSKYPNLRGPLAAFTNQSNANTSVPRYVNLCKWLSIMKKIKLMYSQQL